MTGRLLRAPALQASLLLLSGWLLLGYAAPRAGLHLDDHALRRELATAPWGEVFSRAAGYTPGRNLYPVLLAGWWRLAGQDPSRAHRLQLTLDLLSVLAAWALLRLLRAPASWALAAAGLFLVWPNHGETHFWLAAGPMCLGSTASLLLAFFAAASSSRPMAVRLPLVFALYLAALFNYDQVFFMWVPLLYFCWRLIPESDYGPRHLLGLGGAFLAADALHFGLRVWAPSATGGRPMAHAGAVVERLVNAVRVSVVPLDKLPRWEFLDGWGRGPWAGVALAVVLAAAWAAWCVGLAREEGDAPPEATGL